MRRMTELASIKMRISGLIGKAGSAAIMRGEIIAESEIEIGASG